MLQILQLNQLPKFVWKILRKKSIYVERNEPGAEYQYCNSKKIKENLKIGLAAIKLILPRGGFDKIYSAEWLEGYICY
jgi:hypothetical protein